MEKEDVFSVNERELMDYYKFSGSFGKIKLRMKFIKSWILHSFAYSSPLSDFSISMQRKRGVKIGENCHFSSYVLIDLLYPQLITIEDNVTVSHNAMIFAHINPTTNLFLKTTAYPRKVEKVTIKKGAIISPGAIITAGVTIGENSIISIGSVVAEDIPDNCIVVGNPARVVKKI